MPGRRYWLHEKVAGRLICQFEDTQYILAEGLLVSFQFRAQWLPICRVALEKLWYPGAWKHGCRRDRAPISAQMPLLQSNPFSTPQYLFYFKTFQVFSTPLVFCYMDTMLVIFTQILSTFLCHCCSEVKLLCSASLALSHLLLLLKNVLSLCFTCTLGHWSS